MERTSPRWRQAWSAAAHDFRSRARCRRLLNRDVVEVDAPEEPALTRFAPRSALFTGDHLSTYPRSTPEHESGVLEGIADELESRIAKPTAAATIAAGRRRSVGAASAASRNAEAPPLAASLDVIPIACDARGACGKTRFGRFPISYGWRRSSRLGRSAATSADGTPRSGSGRRAAWENVSRPGTRVIEVPWHAELPAHDRATTPPRWEPSSIVDDLG